MHQFARANPGRRLSGAWPRPSIPQQ